MNVPFTKADQLAFEAVKKETMKACERWCQAYTEWTEMVK